MPLNKIPPGPKLIQALLAWEDSKKESELLQKWAACVCVEEYLDQDVAFKEIKFTEDWEQLGDGFASRKKNIEVIWGSGENFKSLGATFSSGVLEWKSSPFDAWVSEDLLKAQSIVWTIKESLWPWFDLIKCRSYGVEDLAHMEIASVLIGRQRAQVFRSQFESELIKKDCFNPDGEKVSSKRL